MSEIHKSFFKDKLEMINIDMPIAYHPYDSEFSEDHKFIEKSLNLYLEYLKYDINIQKDMMKNTIYSNPTKINKKADDIDKMSRLILKFSRNQRIGSYIMIKLDSPLAIVFYVLSMTLFVFFLVDQLFVIV